MTDASRFPPARRRRKLAIEIAGIYNGQAWVPDPINWGAPVLFDIFMRPKPAYYAVQAALAGR